MEQEWNDTEDTCMTEARRIQEEKDGQRAADAAELVLTQENASCCSLVNPKAVLDPRFDQSHHA